MLKSAQVSMLSDFMKICMAVNHYNKNITVDYNSLLMKILLAMVFTIECDIVKLYKIIYRMHDYT